MRASVPPEPPPTDPRPSVTAPNPRALAQRVSAGLLLVVIATLALATGILRARASWRSLREIHPMAELYESVTTRLSRAPNDDAVQVEPTPFVLVDAPWIAPREEQEHLLRERVDEAPPAVSALVAVRSPIKSVEHILDDAL